MRCYCLASAEFQFWKIKTFWDCRIVMFAQDCEYTSCQGTEHTETVKVANVCEAYFSTVF